ncbi:MAG: bacteriohemerythrin [Spirochaetales bacterium]|nr:bacteriohemerythrin [Spirochaetales bacterium]
MKVSLKNRPPGEYAKSRKYSVSRFAPRELLRVLTDSRIPLELGRMQKREMTIFFSDIRSFASISEKMQPEFIFRYLNAFLKMAAPIIRSHEGIIDKYIGDAILAVFPHPKNAIASAIAIHHALKKLNRRLARIHLPIVDLGIGVHTGELMIGILGESKRMDVTVIADSVNVASRLQDLNKIYGSNILISDSVYQKLFSDPTADYSMRFLDVVRTKGKKEATCVYEIYDNISTSSIARRNNTKKDFEKGVWLYHAEKYAEAARNFLEVIKEDPNDRVAIFYMHRTAHFLATSYSLITNHTDRLFAWDDKYSVGIRGIDDQHKKLFDIINDLNWAKCNSIGRSFISDILNRLVVYTIAHFSVEEELMLRYNYSQYRRHKTAHENFKEKIGLFIVDYNRGKTEITDEILEYLIKWLQAHTTGEDKKMSQELPIHEEENLG